MSIASNQREITQVPFVDLAAQYSGIEGEINAAIQQALVRTDFILGRDVTLFEEEAGSYLNTQVATVSSGTMGLIFALQALGLERGQKVILPSFTFMATAQAGLTCPRMMAMATPSSTWKESSM